MRITQIQRIYGTQRYGYLFHTDTTDSTEKYSACTDGGKRTRTEGLSKQSGDKLHESHEFSLYG